ncbi:MAG: hypothetical protein NTV57_15630 [Cyanobacteria bacterium]|nr:hypothetical protein [Cyanobacteriota bacterium]
MLAIPVGPHYIRQVGASAGDATLLEQPLEPTVDQPRPEMRDVDLSALPDNTPQIPQAIATAQDQDNGNQFRTNRLQQIRPQAPTKRRPSQGTEYQKNRRIPRGKP